MFLVKNRRYPSLAAGVELETRLEENGKLCFYIQNMYGDKFKLNEELYQALEDADGFHPIQIPGLDSKKLTAFLEENDLISYSPIIQGDGIFDYLSVVQFYDESSIEKYKPFCQFMNRYLLPISAVVSAAGILALITNHDSLEEWLNFNPILYIALNILCIVLHEAGHFMAYIGIGIVLLKIITVGFFVAADPKKTTVNKEEVHASLAGIEMQLLLFGVFWLIGGLNLGVSYTFLEASKFNLLIMLVNIMPAFGFDGEQALSAALGVDDIYKKAKMWLGDNAHREKLLSHGKKGYLFFGLYAFVLLAKWIVVSIGIINLVYILQIIFS